MTIEGEMNNENDEILGEGEQPLGDEDFLTEDELADAQADAKKDGEDNEPAEGTDESDDAKAKKEEDAEGEEGKTDDAGKEEGGEEGTDDTPEQRVDALDDILKRLENGEDPDSAGDGKKSTKSAPAQAEPEPYPTTPAERDELVAKVADEFGLPKEDVGANLKLIDMAVSSVMKKMIPDVVKSHLAPVTEHLAHQTRRETLAWTDKSYGSMAGEVLAAGHALLSSMPELGGRPDSLKLACRMAAGEPSMVKKLLAASYDKGKADGASKKVSSGGGKATGSRTGGKAKSAEDEMFDEMLNAGSSDPLGM